MCEGCACYLGSKGLDFIPVEYCCKKAHTMLQKNIVAR